MGVRMENHCCDCGLPCLGRTCSLSRVPIAFCDSCGYEPEEFYERGGEILCEDCYVEAELKDAKKVKLNSPCVCAWCEEEVSELYMVENDGVCKECFIDATLEKADPVDADSLVDSCDYC